MPEGPLGFPRLTDLGPFVESENLVEIDDKRLRDAANDFSPDFDIRNGLLEEEYWRTWDTRENEGITGIWIKEQSLMIVSPRGLMHHNQQFNSLKERGSVEGTLMPWAAGSIGDEYHIDIPASGGGLFQAVTRFDGDVSTARSGAKITQNEVWPVVYTCYMLDIPFVGVCNATYDRDTPGPSMIDVQDETFQMGTAYNLLSFSLAGLPEPKLNRSG